MRFLDIPILFVIVMLGAMRPNTWTLFVTGTALALVAAAFFGRILMAVLEQQGLLDEIGMPG